MAYNFVANGDYVEFWDGPHLVRSLHKTSNCISWGFDASTPLRISFEIDNLDYDNIAITDIQFSGVAMVAEADFATGIATLFPRGATGSFNDNDANVISVVDGIVVSLTNE